VAAKNCRGLGLSGCCVETAAVGVSNPLYAGFVRVLGLL
jgi:hypothetical protein